MESALYRRREPETTVLYQVVQENLETFIDVARARNGRGLPKYVVSAFRKFLDCGILARGFVRVRCPDCGYDTVVAFSCKERGLCPSCSGRRMSETAAYLVDEVFPHVPVRQWVLSVPWPVRYALARDAKLLSGAVRIFVEEIFRDLRRRSGVRPARLVQCGAVTGVQRFGSALNLNVHLHTLVVDGVFVAEGPDGKLVFRPLPAPTGEDLDRVLARVKSRLAKLLEPTGCLSTSSAEETPSEEPEAIELFQAASIREMIGLSGEPRRVPVLGRREDGEVEPWKPKPLCVASEWYSLNAAVRISRTDREGLERVCRYVLRPAFAEDRLVRLPDGRVLYEFRRPRRDGSTQLLITPLELLEKLAALVPPPRYHLVRYHGVFAPHARRRSEVVPDPPAEEACALRRRKREEGEASGRPRPKRRRRKRLDWATLLKRTFAIDVLACPRCGGRMAVIATITEPSVARKILRAMGLGEEAPVAAAARPPPEGLFLSDQDSR